MVHPLRKHEGVIHNYLYPIPSKLFYGLKILPMMPPTGTLFHTAQFRAIFVDVSTIPQPFTFVGDTDFPCQFQIS